LSPKQHRTPERVTEDPQEAPVVTELDIHSRIFLFCRTDPHFDAASPDLPAAGRKGGPGPLALALAREGSEPAPPADGSALALLTHAPPSRGELLSMGQNASFRWHKAIRRVFE